MEQWDAENLGPVNESFVSRNSHFRSVLEFVNKLNDYNTILFNLLWVSFMSLTIKGPLMDSNILVIKVKLHAELQEKVLHLASE